MPRARHSRPSRRGTRRALLGAYVAPAVVAHIMSDGRMPLLSGVRLPVIVLFADIRNFTPLADALPAERVVTILDEYFDAMTAAASAHGAMIDKLIGDAIMLVFGVPRARGDEALRALATAAAMHRAFRQLLRGWRKHVPANTRIGLGIGCAAGEAVLANVGSAARMDYTLIGAPVNLAARLVAAARPGTTLVSAGVRATVAAAPHAAAHFGRARRLRLKGLRRPVTAYTAEVSCVRRRARVPRVLVDPVCGMKLQPQHALSLVYDGQPYHFCSARCRTAFRRSPTRYIRS